MNMNQKKKYGHANKKWAVTAGYPQSGKKAPGRSLNPRMVSRTAAIPRRARRGI